MQSPSTKASPIGSSGLFSFNFVSTLILLLYFVFEYLNVGQFSFVRYLLRRFDDLYLGK